MKMKITNVETGEQSPTFVVDDQTTFDQTDFNFLSDSDLPGPVIKYTGEIEEIKHGIESVQVTTKDIRFTILPEELPPFAAVGQRITIEMQFVSIVWYGE